MFPRPSPTPSFFARNSLSLVLIVAASSILALSLYYGKSSGSVLVVQEKQARETIKQKQATLQERLNKYSGKSVVEITEDFRRDPRAFVGIAAFGLLSLLIMGMGAAGLVLFVWFLVRWVQKRPVIPKGEVIAARWNVWDALGAGALLIVAILLNALIMPAGQFRVILSILLAYVIVLLYAAYLVEVRQGQPLAAAGVRKDAFAANLWRGAIAYVTTVPLLFGAAVLNLVISMVVFGSKPRTLHPLIYANFETNSPLILILYAVVMVVVGPIVEEFLFRGLLLGALRSRLSAPASIVISAAVFSTAHQNLYQVLPLFVIGCSLGYVYERTRSIAASATMHVMQNAVAMSFILLLKFAG